MFKKRNFIITGVSVLLACLMVLSGVQVGHTLDQKPLQIGSLTIGYGKPVIKIGMAGVEAAGTADYTCSGVNDDVVVQTALNALPSNGGRLQFLSGNYSFSATVSRIIPNVMISGDGASVRFTFDGTTPLFTAGGNSWSFQNLVTDAGGINLGATLNWTEINVVSGTQYYAYRAQNANASLNTVNATQLTATTGNISTLNAPTGRGATYVIAAADAPQILKNQADNVTTTDVGSIINYAISANYTDIYLTQGSSNLSFPLSTTINVTDFIHLHGAGNAATVIRASNGVNLTAMLYTKSAGTAVSSYIEIDHLRFDGNNASAGSVDGIFGKFSTYTGYIHDSDFININRDAIVLGSGVDGARIENCNFDTIGRRAINTTTGYTHITRNNFANIAENWIYCLAQGADISFNEFNGSPTTPGSNLVYLSNNSFAKVVHNNFNDMDGNTFNAIFITCALDTYNIEISNNQFHVNSIGNTIYATVSVTYCERTYLERLLV